MWVDETEYVDQRLDRSQKPSSLALRMDPLGINTEDMGYGNHNNINVTVADIELILVFCSQCAF